MTVTLLGIGCGTTATITSEGLTALRQADVLIGSKRLLDSLPADCISPKSIMFAATKPQNILDFLQNSGGQNPCVIYSGDSGFYSGARSLLPLLKQLNIQVSLLPGISSVQTFAAHLERPWQNWNLVSAHGVACDPVAAVMQGRPAFFLTGGSLGPASLCTQFVDAGLGDLHVTVGENLTSLEETITFGTAADFAEKSFAPLSVLLAEAAPAAQKRTPGWPDDAFVRGDKIPMTKQEVRAAVLAKLAVTPEEICWDIGAGTGSVSVELALQSRAVWAVECKPAACTLIEENARRFHVYNLHLVPGTAPEVLAQLPRPDAVFVGGSGGQLPQILRSIHTVNPFARICVSAIALETLSAACKVFQELDYQIEVTQICVSRAKMAGELHLLFAQNPVFLITGAAK